MKPSRRQFCATSTAMACAATAAVTSTGLATNLLAAQQEKAKPEICGFIKFIQELSYDELAETMASQGYQGVEATIRPKGLIEPKDAPQQLPKLVAALKKQNLNITIMTTNVNQADDPVNQTLLKTAADLGITRYRTDYYRYDMKKPIAPQVDSFRPLAEGLAKLNREIGITAVYQNHSGAKYLGSTMWDLHLLLKDIDPDEIGIAFDIRHATASAGASWPVYWSIVQSHLKAIYIKDFHWVRGEKAMKTEHVPLGTGAVDPAFFKIVADSDFKLPISLHVEYLKTGGLQKNIEAMAVDLKKLHKFIGIN